MGKNRKQDYPRDLVGIFTWNAILSLLLITTARIKNAWTWLFRLFERIKAGGVSSPTWSFIVLASFFGSLTIVLSPPFSGADEEAHFTRAYGLAAGNVIIRQGEKVEMPVAYRETLGCLQFKQVTPGAVYEYRYDQYGRQKATTLDCMASIDQSAERKEYVVTTAAGYSPATYIPQVAAITIGKIFHAPVIAMDYLVRFAVMIAYIALIATAIKIIPNRKWALVGVALLPHSIMQVTNPGGDYMLLGATAIFIAIILRSRQLSEVQLKKRGKILLAAVTVTAAFMVLPKGIFPGICFLPLVIFFGGFRRYFILKILIMIAVCSVGVLWQKFVFISGMDLSGGAQSITNFPYAFMKTMFIGWANSDFIYVRIGLGLDNEVGMPALAITLMNMLFAVYVFVGYSKDKVKASVLAVESRAFGAATILVAAAVISGSFAALYIAGAYLQGEDSVIKGVQARYFYPAFILLAVAPFARVFTASRTVYVSTVLIGSSILQAAHILAIAVRFDWL